MVFSTSMAYLLNLCCIAKCGCWYRHIAEAGKQQLKLNTNLAADSSIYIYWDYFQLVAKLIAVDRLEHWTSGVVETPVVTWVWSTAPSYNKAGGSLPPWLFFKRFLTCLLNIRIILESWTEYANFVIVMLGYLKLELLGLNKAFLMCRCLHRFWNYRFICIPWPESNQEEDGNWQIQLSHKVSPSYCCC